MVLHRARANHEQISIKGVRGLRNFLSFRQTGQRNEQEQLRNDGHEDTSNSTSTSQFYTSLTNWWQELTACLLSVVALLAIIATLRPHQNKPLPQWPYLVSVNSLLSIYVTILKAAVLLVIAEGLSQLKWQRFEDDRPLDELARYDEASRGPMGSLRLLWRLRLQHPLTSVGAFAVIFAIITDPTTQQIVQYYDCTLLLEGAQASLPRTNVYIGQGRHAGAGLRTIEPPLQAAINAGIFSPGRAVSSRCDTGNCTFPDIYHTLGYCSSCTDVSEQVVVNSSYRDDKSLGRVTNKTFHLPSGTQLFQSTPVFRNPIDVLTVSSHDRRQIDLLKGPVPPDNCVNPSATGAWSCDDYAAATCSMNFCVRTYKSIVSAGNLEETLISQTGLPNVIGQATSGVFFLSLIDTSCISSGERTALQAAGYEMPVGTPWLPYKNATFKPLERPPLNASFPESMLERNCVYSVDGFLDSSLWSVFLKDFFNGTVKGLPSVAIQGDILRYDGPQNLQVIYNFGNVTFENIEQTFANISNSVTNYLRQNGNVNHSEPALGQVNQNRTCIDVRWAWLSFSVIQVMITLLFFTAMVVETSSKGNPVPIWKSSPLALLYHGFERQPTHAGGERLREMERAARGTLVSLGTTQTGIKLVERRRKSAAHV